MTADLKAARERVEHLAKVYAARANRKLTPDWSAAQKVEDAANSKALSNVLTALDQAAEALKPFEEAAEFWSAIYDDSEVMKTPTQFVDAWRAKHGKRRPVPAFVNGDLRRAATVYATLKPVDTKEGEGS